MSQPLRAHLARLCRPRALALLALCAAVPAALGLISRSRVRALQAPCETTAKPAVVVDTAARTLHLCRAGRPDASFPVALGRNGVGKTSEGDGRTPVGTYRLAPARPSVAGLYRFLHIGFPTPAQRKAGLTGSAIGVHGPPRRSEQLGLDFARLGVTDGCVALSRDAQVDVVAEWVDTWGVSEIILRAPSS